MQSRNKVKAHLGSNLKHIDEFDSLGHGPEVERLTLEIVTAVNSGKLDDPVVTQRIVSEYTISGSHALLDNPAWSVGSMSLKERLKLHEEFMASNPDFAVEFTEVSTYMDEALQTADVLLNTKTSGLSTGRNGHGITVMRWEWRKVKWMCVKTTVMRGSVEIFG